MRETLEAAVKAFDPNRHLVHLLHGPWVDLRDETGRVLTGIRGCPGAYGTTVDGKTIGADLIEMAPGAAFAPHTHEGDHLLFVISGSGFVRIDGRDQRIRPGDSAFIAGAHPHAVRAATSSPGPLTFLAVGVPHKHLSSPDRMTLVEGQ